MGESDASAIRAMLQTEMQRFVDQVDERFDRVENRLEKADDKHEEERRSSSESRRRTYEKIENVERGQADLRVDVADIKGRLATVEARMAANDATIDEYRTWQAQIRGVSRLGRALWFIAAALAAMAAFVVTNWERLRHLIGGRG